MSRPWQRWTLRRRIVSVSAIGLVILSVLGITGFSLALDSILARSATDASRVQAGQLAALIKAGKYSPVDAITNLPAEGSVLQVIEPSGRILASTRDSLKDTAISSLHPDPGKVVVTRVDHLGDSLIPYAVAVEGVAKPGGERYAVVVATPLSAQAYTVSAATALLAGGAVLFGAILLLAVGRIVKGALEPVRVITGQVSGIRRAGSDERVTVPPAKDEIAALAETMNSMLDRLARADVATRRFISDASHELRSPLATLRVQLETATPTVSASVSDIALMHHEVLRMQTLVEDLLTLARTDDAGLAVQSVEVDLDDLVGAEARRINAILSSPVRTHLEPVTVVGDPGRLGQVLRNLTDNAVRHTAGGIGLTMDATDPWVVSVHVDNDGTPVPVSQREVVFDRFTRLDDSRVRDEGGSGLGLAIARTIARIHGGDVRAGVSPDGQCRFTLTLPRPIERPEADETQRRETGRPAPTVPAEEGV